MYYNLGLLKKTLPNVYTKYDLVYTFEKFLSKNRFVLPTLKFVKILNVGKYIIKTYRGIFIVANELIIGP